MSSIRACRCDRALGRAGVAAAGEVADLEMALYGSYLEALSPELDAILEAEPECVKTISFFPSAGAHCMMALQWGEAAACGRWVTSIAFSNWWTAWTFRLGR